MWWVAVLLAQGVTYDISYGDKHERQKLDLYIPHKAKNAKVLIFVHGGSWRNGDKSGYAHIGNTFSAKGHLTVTINYRLSPNPWPAHIEDVALAFAWVKKNIAELGGDPSKIFLMGHSAGAHLVTLLVSNEKYIKAHGYSSKDVAGVIPISGAYTPDVLQKMFWVFKSPEVIADASPSLHVHEGMPPFFMLYAEGDFGADTNTPAMADLIAEKGNDVKYFEIKNRGHITIILWIGRPGDIATARILNFLHK